VLHDRDAKFCAAFDEVLASEGNSLLFPAPALKTPRRDVRCRQAAAACFDIIPAPLEHFGHTASVWLK